MIFTADADDVLGRELWFSDGTTSGTRLLRDLAPGPDPSRAAGFTLHGNVVLFRAYDGREGMKLWQTDGTPSGTRIVDDRFSASFDSVFVRSPEASGTRVFFTASDDELASAKLWVTEGTSVSTKSVLGPFSTPPRYPFNSPLFAYKLFALGDGACLWTPWHPAIRTELWFSDGAREHSGLLRDFSTNTDLDASAPGGFVLWQGSVYLSADTGINQFDRFRLPLDTLKLEPVDFDPVGVAWGPWVSGDAMYFVRRISSRRTQSTGQLVRINRTPQQNTTYAPELGPESLVFDVRGFIEFHGRTYFNVSHGVLHYELWRTAANGLPTVERLPFTGYLAGVCNDRLLIDRTTDLAAADAQDKVRSLFDNSGGANFRFVTHDGQHAWVASTPYTGPHSLWVTDGTIGGTRRVRDFPPSSLNRIGIHALTSGILWFAVAGEENAASLWRSDGTTTGTRLVMSPAWRGTDGGLGGQMTADANGRVYFTARDPLRGMELFSVQSDLSVGTGPARIANLSVRAKTPASGEPLTAGFVVRGTAPATTLVRSAGPALEKFGVSGVATNPVLVLYRGAVALAANDDWQAPAGSAADPTVHSAAGALPFSNGSRDAALLQSLPVGTYTVQALAQPATTALTEIFHLFNGTGTEFANLSCRHQLAVGDDDVIAGFVLAGNGARRILIRAIGPGLRQFGVSNVCPDPILELREGAALLATNDNWSAQADSDDVAVAAATSGAFRLEPDSKDAAIVRELPAGSYSVVVRDRATLGGEVLVELYVLNR